ncbi:hypothetical protein EV426DRAFT_578505 [Tirmania nivea]|nr:hypothetical protein EV426DRAFT_578505 [Tirmania nivea]
MVNTPKKLKDEQLHWDLPKPARVRALTQGSVGNSTTGTASPVTPTFRRLSNPFESPTIVGRQFRRMSISHASPEERRLLVTTVSGQGTPKVTSADSGRGSTAHLRTRRESTGTPNLASGKFRGDVDIWVHPGDKHCLSIHELTDAEKNKITAGTGWGGKPGLGADFVVFVSQTEHCADVVVRDTYDKHHAYEKRLESLRRKECGDLTKWRSGAHQAWNEDHPMYLVSSADNEAPILRMQSRISVKDETPPISKEAPKDTAKNHF